MTKAAEIRTLTIASKAGATADIVTMGAALRDLRIPTGKGLQRVVLGYEDPASYAVSPNYIGATAGRYCNRIARGRVEIDGVAYQLGVNEKDTAQLHGGATGFSYRNWTVVVSDERSVLLELISGDGEEGYPGEVRARCLYEFIEPATLRITLTARTDAPTFVNLTNHAYFTLNNAGDSREHLLRVNADFYTPADENLLPTGEILAVAGTPFDFREERRIADGGIPYDVNFVLRRFSEPLPVVASLTHPASALTLRVASNQPGVQLYDGAGVVQHFAGIDGQIHKAFAGICLETQVFPDSPNQRHFPQARLNPGERYCNITEYRFSGT
ncbi:MAG: galactose mutarotase [Methylobacteriaceae bacterium]|jgi:aldose 1-epimerase|nr:galactose mutarotase [Methylobacteriaceae bacterium]